MNEHEEDRGLSLQGLRDDGGRPLPASGGDILQLGQRALRRRRTAQVLGAGTAALVVAVGGVWLADSTLTGKSSTDPGIATQPTASPAPREVRLATSPLLTVADMPRVDPMEWTARTTLSGEGDCDVPLSSRKYQQIAFDGRVGGDGHSGSAAQVAGEAGSVAAAERVFDETVAAFGKCLSNPDGLDVIYGASGNTGDESFVRRVERLCSPPKASADCMPVAAYAGFARRGRVLVSVTFSIVGQPGTQFPKGSTEEVTRTEGAELLTVAMDRAVAR